MADNVIRAIRGFLTDFRTADWKTYALADCKTYAGVSAGWPDRRDSGGRSGWPAHALGIRSLPLRARSGHAGAGARQLLCGAEQLGRRRRYVGPHSAA